MSKTENTNPMPIPEGELMPGMDQVIARIVDVDPHGTEASALTPSLLTEHEMGQLSELADRSNSGHGAIELFEVNEIDLGVLAGVAAAGLGFGVTYKVLYEKYRRSGKYLNPGRRAFMGAFLSLPVSGLLLGQVGCRQVVVAEADNPIVTQGPPVDTPKSTTEKPPIEEPIQIAEKTPGPQPEIVLEASAEPTQAGIVWRPPSLEELKVGEGSDPGELAVYGDLFEDGLKRVGASVGETTYYHNGKEGGDYRWMYLARNAEGLAYWPEIGGLGGRKGEYPMYLKRGDFVGADGAKAGFVLNTEDVVYVPVPGSRGAQLVYVGEYPVMVKNPVNLPGEGRVFSEYWDIRDGSWKYASEVAEILEQNREVVIVGLEVRQAMLEWSTDDIPPEMLAPMEDDPSKQLTRDGQIVKNGLLMLTSKEAFARVKFTRSLALVAARYRGIVKTDEFTLGGTGVISNKYLALFEVQIAPGRAMYLAKYFDDYAGRGGYSLIAIPNGEIGELMVSSLDDIEPDYRAVLELEFVEMLKSADMVGQQVIIPVELDHSSHTRPDPEGDLGRKSLIRALEAGEMLADGVGDFDFDLDKRQLWFAAELLDSLGIT